jgi:polyisoprenoid-binding protein YceI
MNERLKAVPAAALVWALAAAAMGATATLGPGSKVWLEGDSTLHPFTSVSKEFKVDLTVGQGTPQTLAAGLAAKAPAAMTVTIPVKSLKSDKKGLDKNLYKALEAEKSPDIVYVMSGYTLADGKVQTKGTLSVAGKTKEQALTGTLSLADGKAVVDGEQPLLMTDFGIKPPSMMLGAVKTKDQVLVKFHLELEQAVDEHKGEDK